MCARDCEAAAWLQAAAQVEGEHNGCTAIEHAQQDGRAFGIGCRSADCGIEGQPVAVAAASVVGKMCRQHGRSQVHHLRAELGQGGRVDCLPIDRRRGRERRRDDAAVGAELPADEKLLHAVGGGAQHDVVTIVELAIDRVDTDHDETVNQPTGDANARQRGGNKFVGSGTNTAQGRVAAQIGTDQQREVSGCAADLKQLEGADRHQARSVAHGHKLTQRTLDVGVPSDIGAASCNTAGTTGNVPLARANSAARAESPQHQRTGANARQCDVGAKALGHQGAVEARCLQ